MVEIVIITGMSGAGRTAALKCLEDMGYYAMDNLPASLIKNVVAMSNRSPDRFNKIALVMDVRGGRSFEDLFSAIDALEGKGIDYTIMFLDAEDDVLVRRFSETRRMHPLETEGLRVVDTIAAERKLLDLLRERADIIIDTSEMNIYQLRDKLKEVLPDTGAEHSPTMTVVSFGYKHGLPMDADYVFDTRFLPNPFWIPELKDKSGLDREVIDYVMGQPGAQDFVDNLAGLMVFLLPMFIKERRGYIIMAIGCTGGRHRSVVVTDKLAGALETAGYHVGVQHRDIDI